MRTYVIGTDGSETSARAAKRACELAAATGATLHVVCAYERRGGWGTEHQRGTAEVSYSALDEAQGVADEQAATFRAQGMRATAAAVDGKPADVLIAEAERLEAELIVVGNRRMQGFARVLGSVANDVAHHATCDVLVVRTI